MRHTSLTLLVLLLGCSGTPVSAPERGMFPVLQPLPDQKEFQLTAVTNDLTQVVKYRDAIDLYAEYLVDYSRRISETHGLVSKHKQSCPVLLTTDPLLAPPYPITTGMNAEETIDVLVSYIGELRSVMQNHNRSEQLLKEKSLQLCESFK